MTQPRSAEQPPVPVDAREPGLDGNAADRPPADAAVDQAAGGPPSTGVFRHPGVLLNRAQLTLMRDQVKAGAEPWKSGFDKARLSMYAALTWTPKPREVVECGSGSNPNFGCSDERGDALAAYTDALLWNITGDEAYARKSIEILNAWGPVLRTHTNHNAPLQAGWSGVGFSRAAEIMRWTYPAWAKADVDGFASMLKTAFVPLVAKSSGANGNWELVMIEATIGITVFTEDRALFDKAAGMWRKRVPAYIYLRSDGPYPVPPPVGDKSSPASIIAFWQGATIFVDGLAQETCRDFGHTGWGIAAAIDVAETAFQQGLDLYKEESTRLRAGLEFHADYLTGTPIPSWLCGGTVSLGTIPMWEIAFNHYNGRLGLPLPRTKTLIETKVRPSGASYFIAWETLTHAGAGWTGLK